MAEDRRLKKGQKVRLKNGGTVTVTGKLGNGGQGIVYRVKIDKTGEERALKWFYAEKINDIQKFYDNLENNIRNGSPSDAFVWPEQLTEKVNGTFGYIMGIYPERYQEFTKFLLAKEQFKSVAAMINAALNIVTAFMKLHDAGYNYQDLNNGNFAIDPETGDVQICDNDNVAGHGYSSGVLGKPRYMAPEVVRREVMPNKLTDRFSLAVILFLLLVGDHPLEGSMTNVPALTNKYDRKFFGENPLFIFDEYDSSNMPVRGMHVNAITLWPCYPEYIHRAFQQSFSQKSLMKAEGRLLEIEWVHLLMRLKSSLVKCPNCGRELFIENKGTTMCPKCKSRIRPLGYLEHKTRRSNIKIRVPIIEGATLYGYHMEDDSEDYVKEAGKVIAKPGKIGLKNLSSRTWKIDVSGKSAVRKPGEVVVLFNNETIMFGDGCTVTVAAD